MFLFLRYKYFIYKNKNFKYGFDERDAIKVNTAPINSPASNPFQGVVDFFDCIILNALKNPALESRYNAAVNIKAPLNENC